MTETPQYTVTVDGELTWTSDAPHGEAQTSDFVTGALFAGAEKIEIERENNE